MQDQAKIAKEMKEIGKQAELRNAKALKKKHQMELVRSASMPVRSQCPRVAPPRKTNVDASTPA
jgi:hypothetical protein